MGRSAASRFACAAKLAKACADDRALCAAVDEVGAALATALASGRKVLVAGNGGSMAQASHLAEECTGRFRGDRKPFAVIALDSAAHITCSANDYGFEEVFARMVTALGRPGDAFLALSTSGQSENLVRAAVAARTAGMTCLALLGKGGGHLHQMVDTAAVFPGETADEVQDLHMVAVHSILERLEADLCGI